ncbi:MAG: hypothetical protein ABSH34_30425 [Verrucomicrobiota bacterium]
MKARAKRPVQPWDLHAPGNRRAVFEKFFAGRKQPPRNFHGRDK